MNAALGKGYEAVEASFIRYQNNDGFMRLQMQALNYSFFYLFSIEFVCSLRSGFVSFVSRQKKKVNFLNFVNQYKFCVRDRSDSSRFFIGTITDSPLKRPK
jgi:hypothetical protein